MNTKLKNTANILSLEKDTSVIDPTPIEFKLRDTEIGDLIGAEARYKKYLGEAETDDQQIARAEIIAKSTDVFRRLSDLSEDLLTRPIYIRGLLAGAKSDCDECVRHLAGGIALGQRPFTFVDENKPRIADRQSPKAGGVAQSNSTDKLHGHHNDLVAGAPFFQPEFIQLTAAGNPFLVDTFFSPLPEILAALGDERPFIEATLRRSAFRHSVSPSFGIDHPGVVGPVLWENEAGRTCISYSSYSTAPAFEGDADAIHALQILDRAEAEVRSKISVRSEDSLIFGNDFSLHGRADARLPSGRVMKRELIRSYYRKSLAALQAIGGPAPYAFRYVEVVSSPDLLTALEGKS